MSDAIRLVEYQAWYGPLAPEDARFIREQLQPRFRAYQLPGEDGWHVEAAQHVGVAPLPSGRRLECRPKVPLGSVFFMLETAFRLGQEWPFREEVAEFAELEDVLELLARHFAELLEQRLRLGLYRAYLEAEDNLPVVRGRIAFAEDARRNYALRHRTWCRWSELAWDVPENQVLRQTARLLAGWGFGAATALRLSRLEAALEEVALGRLTAADVGRFRYHRLNEGYEPLHQLCRLFLEGTSVSEEAGPQPFRAFLVDMNHLFELFVTELLIERAPPGVTVDYQVPVQLDSERQIDMRPDVVLRAGPAAAVADCKYKRTTPGDYEHHDYYQVLSYCTALGVSRGLLLYPRGELPADDAAHVRGSDVVIHRLCIDLSVPWRDMPSACDDFCRRVFTTVSGSG